VELLVLALSFLTILLGAELFTNGIEWFGHRMGLGEGAVGSVLAAVGTALPETTIPVVAILFSGDPHSSDVGLGAILGAPFMLATLAIGVTGAVVVLNRGNRDAGERLALDAAVVRTDVTSFAIPYALAIGVAFLPVEPTWPKLVVAVVLVGLYARYVKRHFDAESEIAAEDLNPLRLHPFDMRFFNADREEPRLRTINVQVIVAVVLIVVGAVAFVESVSSIARGLGVNEILLALVIAPMATELPEGFNAVLWIRQGKDTLAVGNITGAMVFQASIATVVALVFAPQAWVFTDGTRIAFASAAIAFISIGAVLWPLLRRGATGGRALGGRRLLLGGLFYVAYLAVVVVAEVSG
jgi:cation:H+ antiporter